MRKSFKFMLLAAIAVMGLLVPGDVAAVGAKVFPLALQFDLDGEPPDADQVLPAQILANGNQDHSPAIVADPDVCRMVDITINDAAGVTGGPVRVTGTDCWGDPIQATWMFTAGDDDGVHALLVVVGKASGPYFRTVDAITTTALAGCGGADTLTVGYTTQVGYQHPAYGVRKENTQIWGGGPDMGIRWVDPTAFYPVPVLIANTVPGTPGNQLSSIVPGSGAFARVNVGDIVYVQEGVFQPGLVTSPFLVTQWLGADWIQVDRFLLTNPNGVNFQYKKWFLSADPQDGWLPVAGQDAEAISTTVSANGTNVGGTDVSVDCTTAPMPGMLVPYIQTSTFHVATGAAAAVTNAVDLRLAPYTFCRYALQLTTGDDVDAAAANTESISSSLTESWTSIQ